jgi:hypothetical protein
MVCTLGVHFEIEDGWHLYGNGRSDSGLPISVAFDLPSGLEAGPVLWPTPSRLVTAGEILDQVHEESVTLLAPLAVSQRFVSAGTVPVVCRLDWLVCGTGCVPGADTLTLALPFEDADPHPAASAESEIIERAVERLPHLWPENDRSFRQSWNGRRWVVEVEGASELTFFPSIDCALLLDPIETTRSASDRLEVRIDPRASSEASIRGILEVDRAQRRTSYLIDVATIDSTADDEPSEAENERKIDS